MKKLLIIAAALLLQPWAAQAMPRLNIGALNDYLDASKTTQVKRIYNGGTSTAFVKVSVWELVRGPDGKFREVSLDGQDSASRSLVVSPARLIIPASGMQSVRLLYRGERDRERYYRLRFNPVVPEVGDGFEVNADGAKDYKDSLEAGVQVMAGFGSLFYVRPTNTQFKVDIDERQGKLVVRNNGNATVELDRFRACESKGKNCASAVVHRLLPGAVLEFDKTGGRSYAFDLIEGEKKTEIER
ncbi:MULTISPECIES: pilus assembly protein [Pseudomonas]|jgi:P pilus assembly chaperone PapD|uniref:pilus assembly protein n=1 Tax=Pseudomonas TaxID=286 RepID=UPI0008113480|nr:MULTISPECIES: pilus assembly protein [Pseudomonas]ATR82491.1 pilus assembly protein [Pseudomonas sp. HLS-6]MEE3635747.1 molecular chaperone [Pseudomonas sp. AL 58]